MLTLKPACRVWLLRCFNWRLRRCSVSSTCHQPQRFLESHSLPSSSSTPHVCFTHRSPMQQIQDITKSSVLSTTLLLRSGPSLFLDLRLSLRCHVQCTSCHNSASVDSMHEKQGNGESPASFVQVLVFQKLRDYWQAYSELLSMRILLLFVL